MISLKSILKAAVPAAVLLASSGIAHAASATATLNLTATIGQSATLQIADGGTLPTFSSSTDNLPAYTATGAQTIWLKGVVQNSASHTATLSQAAATGFGTSSTVVDATDFTWGTVTLNGVSTDTGTFAMPANISIAGNIATDITSGTFVISAPLTFTQRDVVNAGSYTGSVVFTLASS
jgi:hypothetical protein